MKDTITSHKFYAVWEYKREEKDLNEASKNGLQLVQRRLVFILVFT